MTAEDKIREQIAAHFDATLKAAWKNAINTTNAESDKPEDSLSIETMIESLRFAEYPMPQIEFRVSPRTDLAPFLQFFGRSNCFTRTAGSALPPSYKGVTIKKDHYIPVDVITLFSDGMLVKCVPLTGAAEPVAALFFAYMQEIDRAQKSEGQ
ncbi:hypothetical protein [Martelella mediterranea]|uniref:Uncharacterized protein n=1 Tax=Martelella mediterranea TaxID=293089 RepID=A0A4R3NK50_9HYPH|nr:hypothetical protein [Martelella mediterranea]TCT34634.1 hypothetical protein EDC90_103328 [Martelella mediterranea]